MRWVISVLLGLILFTGEPVHAAPADAREIARLNNCAPKKIEVFKQSLGTDASTIYRVECILPKTKDTDAKGPDAVLIKCDGSLCDYVRAVGTEAK